MKQGTQTAMQEAPLFTVDDHLRVQQQIEEHAYKLWRAGGCCDHAALRNWLQAEREVVEQFVIAYALRPSPRRQPKRPRAKVTEPPILRQRPATKARKPVPTTIM